MIRAPCCSNSACEVNGLAASKAARATVMLSAPAMMRSPKGPDSITT
jgi:hypothetical protein